MNYSYKIIKSIEDFINLKEQWKNLEATSNNKNISLNYDWCYLWWTIFKHKEDNTFGYDKQLNIIVGYSQSGDIGFIAPLILLKRKVFNINISFLEFLGQQWGATTYSLLKSPNYPFNFNYFKRYCQQHISFDILYLRNIPISDMNLYNKLLNINAGCPQLDLTRYSTYQELYTSYPKNLRQNIRTAYNRANKNGKELFLYTSNVSTIDWNDIIKISKSKINDGKYSLYEDSDKKKFFIQISSKMNANFILAKIDKELVSYRYNVLYNGIKFCIDASYDRAFPQYNLGTLTVCKNIEDSYNNNVLLHSMGPGCYDYKLKFTSSINYLGFLVCSSNFFKGKIVSKLFLYYLKKRKSQL